MQHHWRYIKYFIWRPENRKLCVKRVQIYELFHHFLPNQPIALVFILFLYLFLFYLMYRRLSLSETYSYVANHENLRFSHSKCFLQIEKRQKTQRFRNLQNFLLNLFFPIQRQKLNTDKVLNRHKTQHSIGDGASNRVECTTYRLILYTYLIFPRG
jgi:hypothetical protein